MYNNIKSIKTMIEKKGNYDSCEAQQVRQKSAFINQVANFAEYMQKEFIEPSDGNMVLIICAADRTYDKASDERTGACHIVLGGGRINTISLASMMRQDDMQDLFRKARILSVTNAASNGYMADELRRLRSHLNRNYAFLVLPIGYSLLLAVLTAISPAFHLPITIASVIMMVFLTMLIISDIKDLRRKTRRLADSIDGDRRERRHMLGEAMMGMLGQMAHRDRDDDDDE